MEQNQSVTEQSPEVDLPVESAPVTPAPKSSGRTLAYVVVAALVFFILGYGVAWVSFYTVTLAQNDAVDQSVQAALADALANLDLQQVAEAPPTPEPPPSVIENVNSEDQPALGPVDAPITIVEFSDFRCGYCGRFYNQTLTPLMEQYGDQIRFVYRDFPVVGGERAAMAAQCVYAQGEALFWEYHNVLFANQQSLNSDGSLVELAGGVEGIDQTALETCLSENTYQDEIALDIEEGLAYGVRGTPAFFINGNRLIGAQPITAFQSMIDGLLAE